MSATEEIELLKKIIEMQASRIEEQEATIRELRSVKANLEETLEEFKRQFFGVSSEKTSARKRNAKRP